MEQPRDDQGRFAPVEEEVPIEQEAPDPERDEALEALRDEAKKLGWKPREEFTKAPEGWVDADRFMELPQTKVKQYRDREKEWNRREEELNRRLAGMDRILKEGINRTRDQERAAYDERVRELQRQQAEAVEAADLEKYRQAREAEDRLRTQAPQPSAPPVDPFIAEYREKNAWTKDPEAVAFAHDIIERTPGGRQLSMQRQFALVEKHLRETFPEHFPAEQAPRPTISKVDGGGLAGLRRGKTIADLPQEAQQAYAYLTKEMGLKMTEADYIRDYEGQ